MHEPSTSLGVPNCLLGDGVLAQSLVRKEVLLKVLMSSSGLVFSLAPVFYPPPPPPPPSVFFVSLQGTVEKMHPDRTVATQSMQGMMSETIMPHDCQIPNTTRQAGAVSATKVDASSDETGNVDKTDLKVTHETKIVCDTSPHHFFVSSSSLPICFFV
jgi:hypothetical protein